MHYLLIFIFLYSSVLAIGQEITYHEHIRPIIEKHCASCHHSKGSAPFALEKYEQITKHAKTIQLVTKTRYMPPWKANPAFSHFANERILSDTAILLIQKWVEGGVLEGRKRNERSKAKKHIAVSSKPDLILKMQKPLLIPGDNKQHFYCYKIPFELENERPVRAIEFVPGNRKLVHHASYQIIETSATAPIFSEPYYFEYNTEFDKVEDTRDFRFLNLTDALSSTLPTIRFHTGWLPGTTRHEYPKGIGFTMPKRGALLIRNLHYSAYPIPQNDQSEIHIYFADKPITRTLEFAAFKPKNVLTLIPKDTVMTFGLTLKIGSDMSLLNINPHMHKLGKYFKAWAVTPQRDTINLIEIKDWDFNWQEFYQFPKMVKIPKGSFINAEAMYDNTSRNINNPNNPPIDIAFEKGNMDDDREEMMRLVFIYLPYKEGDEGIILGQE